MKNKKVIVVGGGIAGLSAGIYAKKCGFDVTIFESHSIAGGICTSWRRKGYLFEGGMHWLAGSNPSSAINKLWYYLGALDDSVEIRYSEPFIEYLHDGVPIRFYRDVDETERYLISISPDDAKEINNFCNGVRKIKKLEMPIANVRGVKMTGKKSNPPISSIFAMLSAVGMIRKYAGIERDEYISRFSHPGIREVMRAITYPEMGIAPLIFTLGSLAGGDGGFPSGGSLPFANRMVKSFTNAGGEIRYKSQVERVLVENKKAVGVLVNGKRFNADAVIIASDTMAVDKLFDFPLDSKWLTEMRATTSPTMAVFVSLGIDADLRKYPTYGIYKADEPLVISDQTFEYISVANYANDPDYSPAGKSVFTIQLPGDTYDYWKKIRDEGRYEEEKQKIGEELIKRLSAKIPEMAGKVEVCDVATPLTYERYCGNWKGSWMTNMTKDMKMKSYPGFIKGLDGVYFAGQRLMPPGGIPVAMMTGRRAVQYLCKDTGTVFEGEG